MDDERPPPLGTEIALEVVVHGRCILLARQGHRQQTGLLVHDDEKSVLEDDVELTGVTPGTRAAGGGARAVAQGASASAMARSGEVVRPSADAALNASGGSSVRSRAV